MKELRFERQFFAAPQCSLRQEPNRPIMVIVNIPEIVGQAVVRRFVWFGGKVARHLPHDSPVERRRLGGRASEKAGRGNRYQCGSGEEISAVHENLAVRTAPLCNAVQPVGFLILEPNYRFFPQPQVQTEC